MRQYNIYEKSFENKIIRDQFLLSGKVRKIKETTPLDYDDLRYYRARRVLARFPYHWPSCSIPGKHIQIIRIYLRCRKRVKRKLSREDILLTEYWQGLCDYDDVSHLIEEIRNEIGI